MDGVDLDGALRAAFEREPDKSVVERMGARSRILLHDEPGEASPMLRVHTLDQSESAADDSRYQIVGEIARGGVGVIYKGRDRELGRDVALKVLRRDHSSNPEIFERFIEEAQIGGQLQHPGIVPVYGIGVQPDGRPYFTMKLIKGRTLAALLKERKNSGADRRRFLQVFVNVCQTMAYAHSRGVIHRDLKPSNVLVGSFGEVLVVDWGFGKVLGRPERARTDEERTVVATVRSAAVGSESIAGSVMGTPAYMPPEQALGHIEELDEQSDVFSLGAILCRILTGDPPYLGSAKDLLVQAAQARLDGAFERLDACTADSELIRLAKRCLSPLRGNRPENAAALAGIVAGHLSAAEDRAHQAELEAVEERARLDRETRHAAWERRAKKKTRVLAASLLAAILLSGGTYYWNELQVRSRASAARPRIEAALEEATHLGAQARWVEAITLARNGLDLAVASGADSGPASSVLAEMERGHAAAVAAADEKRADSEFVAELEEIRLRRADDFDAQRTDDDYAAALARRGLDTADPEAAAARIRSEFPDVASDIVAALDEWCWLRREKPELDDRDWRPLAEIARAVDPDPWRNELRQAVADRDLQRLQDMAKQSVEKDLPASTLSLIGKSLRDLGDTAAALAHFERAQRFCPGDFWITYLAGSAAWGLDPPDIERAIRHITAASALRPEAALIRGYVARGLAELGKRSEAITIYREIVRTRPESSRWRVRLAFQLYLERRIEEAAEAYGEAVRLDPTDVGARTNLASTLAQLGRTDEFRAEIQEALRRDPNHAPAHTTLATQMLREYQFAEAIESCRKAIELDPEYARAHRILGSALSATRQYADGMKAFREAVRLDPNDASARLGLGRVLRDTGRTEEAIDELTEAVRLAPDQVFAREWLGRALLAVGRIDEAIEHTREALRLDPHNSRRHQNLGHALAKAGRIDEAITEYREAIRLNPDYLLVYEGIGPLLAETGRLDEAIAAYREALRLDPGDSKTHYNLGNALRGLRRYEEAVAEYREALRLDAEDAEAHCNLGASLANLGRFAEALPAVRRGHELGSRRPDWSYPSGAWLADVKRFAALEARLPEFLGGEFDPSGNRERADLAHVCYAKALFAASARLYDTLLDPRVPLSFEIYSYPAACAAALAGCGRGTQSIDGNERARWRAKALEWLRLGLAEGRLKPEEVRAEPDFDGLRDEAELAKLPEPEQDSWRALWSDLTGEAD